MRALSVHNVTFLGADTDELHQHWTALGLRHLSVLDTQVLDPGFVRLIRAEDYAVEAVYHLFRTGAELSRLIDAAAATGARCIYLLTGGRDGCTWEQAAERFCRAIEPCVQEAQLAGVGLAIENASSLYADIHFAHSLRDTITLAELAGIGICIDLFHCWAEADLAGLLRRALPRTQLIQLSDYVLGDRALPARAVPGDGAIPIESFLAQALADGYPFGFDVELLGPRIEAEGRLAAAGRACAAVSEMLDKLGS
ncbi:sugar phosphate isomerase/epimerase [Mycobacterium sp. E796]|uniref:sugar phosphate isomerase/epimerase family protein n=1 Tax=Mycobacterium sp. E796 TaxID=1834151 RepID=UPI0007FF7390|nr:TIM barrel protein [Mycobacterium sp. E796]OBI65316.1 xylose isomerase [Mycobacterium sp. E796]